MIGLKQRIKHKNSQAPTKHKNKVILFEDNDIDLEAETEPLPVNELFYKIEKEQKNNIDMKDEVQKELKIINPNRYTTKGEEDDEILSL